ncbi:extracellular solute-binding protein [Arthrobacter psychrolactophilus]
MMISRRNFTSLSVLAMGTLMLNACSSDKSKGTIQDSSADFGLQSSGYPVVTKPLTLTFSGSKSALAPDYKSMALVQEWQKTTNITVDWQNLPDNVYQEKKNLILASGDLPDAFFNTGLSDSEVATYGTNGTLLALETLIDSHAPNLKKILDARPDIKAAITSSDGHIYTLPSVEELGLVQFPHMIAINKSWLDKLGLAVPTTIDEYHDALLAFKKADPAGGGKTIPLSYEPGTFCGDIVDLIAALGGIPDNVTTELCKTARLSSPPFSRSTRRPLRR